MTNILSSYLDQRLVLVMGIAVTAQSLAVIYAGAKQQLTFISWTSCLFSFHYLEIFSPCLKAIHKFVKTVFECWLRGGVLGFWYLQQINVTGFKTAGILT